MIKKSLEFCVMIKNKQSERSFGILQKNFGSTHVLIFLLAFPVACALHFTRRSQHSNHNERLWAPN
jgi:hypothetical protein